MNRDLLEGVLDVATTALSHPYSSSSTRMRNTYALNVLPRLAGGEPGYKLIDGGGQTKKRFRWKLVGAGVVALFLVMWALGPSERRERVLDVVNPYPRPCEYW